MFSSKKILLVSVLGLCTVGVGALIAMHSAADDKKTIQTAAKPSTSPLQSRSDDGNTAKEQITSQATPLASASETVTAPPKPVGTSGTPLPTSTPSSLAVSLIRAGQVGQTVQFKAYVSGADTGSCSVSYTNEAKQQVGKIGSVTVESNGSTDCTDTDLPVTSFPTGGLWTATLTATSQGLTSNYLTQQITVTK